MGGYERERGTMLRLLDMEKLHALVLPDAEVRAPEMTVFEVSFQPWAYGVAPDGRAYVICNEGVGWEVDYEDRKVHIDVHGSRPKADESGKVFSILPAVTAIMDRADVEEILTDEEIDLADLIRSFGQRLETNFALWRRTFTKAEVPA